MSDLRSLFTRDPVGRWAQDKIRAARAAGRIPSYGSPEWAALPDDDPRRAAAILVAAESWRAEADPVWRDAVHRAEQDGARAAYLRDVDARWGEIQAAWRELSQHVARIERARAVGSDVGLPLDERRRLALTPRPGDYPGRQASERRTA
ncbi:MULTISPECIES: hypothetical protein [Protofrankia]|uniref:DUF2742 domain-containing protein n=1 Tax=Protofrankia coriariae TaxID=1562887 RepID=A0ABR5F260_9ACTN|nr:MULTISPECIES: hypothetical protein [Protofrankia]KLL10809.1 hypothetical protein FrCorBMG51_15430 [Protofrankia coriariae]ONH34011.1 hypothetical protein BL254_18395 [Protofrankia sp. BMG5.30]